MSKRWLLITLLGGFALGMLSWFQWPFHRIDSSIERSPLVAIPERVERAQRSKNEGKAEDSAIEEAAFKHASSSNVVLLHKVSLLLENPHSNESIEKEIQSSARDLSFLDLEQLRIQALDLKQDLQVRQAAVYILSEVGVKAAPALAALAESALPKYADLANPHSRDSVEHSFELSLRMSALEALDKVASQNPEIRNQLEKIVGRQKEPTLRYLAQVSLRGVETGHPGQLQKFIRQIIGKDIE